MHRYVATYIVTLLIFVVLDFAWTRLLLGRFYRKPSGPLMLEHYQPATIVIFQLVYVFGLMFAVVPRWVGDHTNGQNALYATLYALGIYGLLNMTLTDTAWGIAITVAAGCLGVTLGQML